MSNVRHQDFYSGLALTEREVAAVSGLSPGVALWKVGQRSFVVEHLVSRAVDRGYGAEGGDGAASRVATARR